MCKVAENTRRVLQEPWAAVHGEGSTVIPERLLLLWMRRENSATPVLSLVSRGKVSSLLSQMPVTTRQLPQPTCIPSLSHPSPNYSGYHGARGRRDPGRGRLRAHALRCRLSALLLLEEVINSLTCRALTRPPRIDRILLSCNEFYGLFQYILAMFLQ